MNIIKILLLVFMLQHPGNPPMPPPGCDNEVPGIKNPNCDPHEIPLTGMEWLALAGGLYGIKKLKDKQK